MPSLPVKRKLTIIQGATFRAAWIWKPGGVPTDFTGCKGRMQPLLPALEWPVP